MKPIDEQLAILTRGADARRAGGIQGVFPCSFLSSPLAIKLRG